MNSQAQPIAGAAGSDTPTSGISRLRSSSWSCFSSVVVSLLEQPLPHLALRLRRELRVIRDAVSRYGTIVSARHDIASRSGALSEGGYPSPRGGSAAGFQPRAMDLGPRRPNRRVDEGMPRV